MACTLTVILGLVLSNDAIAEKNGIRFAIDGDLAVDCTQPVQVQNASVRLQGTGALNANRSATADLVITSFVSSSTIHFDAHLGGAPRAAPGGTTQLHVIGRNRLRLVWNLPNNLLTVDIATTGQSCSASLGVSLKPGKQQYTLFDGSRYYFCARPRILRTSCQGA
jgi:hypothetical protein